MNIAVCSLCLFVLDDLENVVQPHSSAILGPSNVFLKFQSRKITSKELIEPILSDTFTPLTRVLSASTRKEYLVYVAADVVVTHCVLMSSSVQKLSALVKRYQLQKRRANQRSKVVRYQFSPVATVDDLPDSTTTSKHDANLVSEAST